MFDNIESKLKSLAKLLMGLSVLIGGIWLIYSFSQMSNYNDYLEFRNITDTFDNVYNAHVGIISSITLIVSGFISSLLIYGFGEIIERLKSIDDKLEIKGNKEVNNIFDKMKEVKDSNSVNN